MIKESISTMTGGSNSTLSVPQQLFVTNKRPKVHVQLNSWKFADNRAKPGELLTQLFFARDLVCLRSVTAVKL